ncbi:MAG: site-specific DNA-methyltransferase [Verrucomicrobiaceae bacterium]|nr:site-specific DNA-methyltransferase [Verrucomicrobiaceae bacterium]
MPTLNWIGKEAVINHHLDVPFHLLKDVPELGCGDPGSGNLIVEGDNLLALKALLPYYKGKVKCICIDPPYNTGNEGWAYNDNVNSPAIKKWLGETVGKEGETLDRHDRWLCMMYPRLALLREFLSEDGSIWIALDDNEIGNLRLIMDEVFGRDRFVASNVWQKRYSRENREAIGDVHDYIVVYAMNPARFKACRNKIPPTGKQAKVYKNPNNDPRGRWRPIPLTAQAGHATAEQFYEIVSPSGKKFRPSAGRCWGIAEATYKQYLSEGRIYFGKKGNSQPNLIRYLSEVEGMVPWTWWPHEEVGNTDESSKELLELFQGDAGFNTTPKPSRLIERILQIATNPGDLVLDSFAGSGTTGHAVLKMNRAQEGSAGTPARSETNGGKAATNEEADKSVRAPLNDRRFILVEMDEKIAPDITRERVKRVAEGYKNAKGEKVPGLGGGFRYVRLGEAVFDEHGRIRESVRFADLARHVYFTETGEPLPKERVSAKTPLLGIHHGRAVYLLYNGILKDKSVDGGNVLTSETLAHLPAHDGPKVVYAAGCRFSKTRLEREGITFKQTPYAIRTR